MGILRHVVRILLESLSGGQVAAEMCVCSAMPGIRFRC